MTTNEPITAAAACYVCGWPPHADAAATGGHNYWPSAEADAYFHAEARRFRPPVYPAGATTQEAAYVDAYRPY